MKTFFYLRLTKYSGHVVCGKYRMTTNAEERVRGWNTNNPEHSYAIVPERCVMRIIGREYDWNSGQIYWPLPWVDV